MRFLTVPFAQLNVALAKPPSPKLYYHYISGTKYPQTKELYAEGLALGNNPQIFAKLGGSTTESREYLYYIGTGEYILGEYSFLQSTIEYYRAGVVPLNIPSGSLTPANSFTRRSYGGRNGMIIPQAMDVLVNGQYPYYSQCAGRSNADCEFDTINPSIVLLWFGINEPLGEWIPEVNASDFEEMYRGLIEYSMGRKIVPVLGTIGKNCYNLFGHDGHCYTELVAEYNVVIKELAHEYKLPLIDYAKAFEVLPNQGMSVDNLHPSSPNPINLTANLTDPYLAQYGYNVRNLLTLIMLDELRKEFK